MLMQRMNERRLTGDFYLDLFFYLADFYVDFVKN